MLTSHQSEKLGDIINLHNEGERIILLKGSAGVGKTYLVGVLTKTLRTQFRNKRIMCSAPTHKALAVIRSKMLEDDIKFSTLHSALHYKAVTDRNTGVRSFVSMPSEEYPPIKGISYWIIDEASMVDAEMLSNIRLHSRLQKAVVIFVGDDKQINPVGEEDSAVFLGIPHRFSSMEAAIEHNGMLDESLRGQVQKIPLSEQYVSYEKFPEVELTEIVRQGEGNPIINLSRNLGDIWEYKDSVTEAEVGYRYTENEARIVEELARVNGTDEFKYLAWTNAEVDRMNSMVRHRIYGEFPAKVEIGESIVMDAPYSRKFKSYTTNEEVKVETVHKYLWEQEIALEDGPQAKRENVQLWTYEINSDILILDDISMPIFKRIGAIMTANCRKKTLSYEKRNAFYATFAEFKYNHALTIHKSQGSTYKTTVLNIHNINFNQNLKEKIRLFYTGVTRASDLLILFIKK